MRQFLASVLIYICVLSQEDSLLDAVLSLSALLNSEAPVGTKSVFTEFRTKLGQGGIYRMHVLMMHPRVRVYTSLHKIIL